MPTLSSQSSSYSADEIAARGDEIYEKQIRPRIEASHRGEIVAIDVESGAFEIAKTALAAAERLLAKNPLADIWCVRVGHRALHHVGVRSMRRSLDQIQIASQVNLN